MVLTFDKEQKLFVGKMFGKFSTSKCNKVLDGNHVEISYGAFVDEGIYLGKKKQKNKTKQHNYVAGML